MLHQGERAREIADLVPGTVHRHVNRGTSLGQAKRGLAQAAQAAHDRRREWDAEDQGQSEGDERGDQEGGADGGNGGADFSQRLSHDERPLPGLLRDIRRSGKRNRRTRVLNPVDRAECVFRRVAPE